MLTAIQRKIYETLGIYSHRWTKRPNGLYSFNYHRIGDPDNSSFDPNVFSCDVESFEQQIKFFKTEFDVVTAKEVIDLVNNNKACSGKFALITFDDGYLDNYTLAYPILKQYNCSATMFIATDFINQTIVPWWDEVAWLIKNNDLNILDNIVWKKPNNISQLSKQNIIKLSSFNKEILGATAAKIRSYRKPEPFKGKGIKYVDEFIFRKEGKKK